MLIKTEAIIYVMPRNVSCLKWDKPRHGVYAAQHHLSRKAVRGEPWQHGKIWSKKNF